MNPSIRVCDDHESLSCQTVERVMRALAGKADLLLCAAEILASREILLLVSCAKKRGLVGKLPQRDMTRKFPASFLWRSSEMEFAVRPRRGAGS